ncbi:MAG: hypothetical protein U1E59_10145 [Amaricoccus sp.]
MSRTDYAPLAPGHDRAGPPGAVRAAMLALFGRLGDRSHDTARAVLPRLDDEVGERSRAKARRDLRRRAVAAYDTVEGGGSAALDVALEVILEELETIAGRARHQEQALKAIRLYAPEAWVRRMAQQTLTNPNGAAELPGFLVGNELDAAEINVMATRFIA